MDKIFLSILGIFLFWFLGNGAKVGTLESQQKIKEYCEEQDTKVRLKICIRTINRFTGYPYGPHLFTFFEIN